MGEVVDAPALVTFEEFLGTEQRASQRHEWVGGHTFAMAGGTLGHDVAVNVLSDTPWANGEEVLALRPAARKQGCRTFTGNRLVRGETAAYYPDFMIVCGPARQSLYEQDAALIAEVRSESTASIDRREKALFYATLPSLRLYLLVEPDRRHVEVGSRHGRFFIWDGFGAGELITTEYGTLDIDDFYDAVDHEAGSGAG